MIAIGTLRDFWAKHPDAETPLRAWYAEASRATWRSPADIRPNHGNASFLPNNRVVFNNKGDDYRLVVAMQACSTWRVKVEGCKGWISGRRN